ncbi:hypothetical protein, partial [Klebsiella pneumoniae]|uniref:hypothetical protein n=1 Tax=Klebsiella pneumoniae TaxID=573 RepID=UPI001C4F2054
GDVYKGQKVGMGGLSDAGENGVRKNRDDVEGSLGGKGKGEWRAGGAGVVGVVRGGLLMAVAPRNGGKS